MKAGILTFYKSKLKTVVPVGKSNALRHSVWEDSEK